MEFFPLQRNGSRRPIICSRCCKSGPVSYSLHRMSPCTCSADILFCGGFAWARNHCKFGGKQFRAGPGAASAWGKRSRLPLVVQWWSPGVVVVSGWSPVSWCSFSVVSRCLLVGSLRSPDGCPSLRGGRPPCGWSSERLYGNVSFDESRDSFHARLPSPTVELNV